MIPFFKKNGDDEFDDENYIDDVEDGLAQGSLLWE